ncbi:hypothetical protein EJD97_000664 [Solanum chilense]|uniref:Uncharacterized protein n=1 Tax=Solanum chilense TaxID=4083 RepID=A0A6N2BZ23_SOLCI|nr:hypothetical protein EJD97_000664 [Solanum chilense]
MVNSRFNDVRMVVVVNAPVEKLKVRGRSRGKGRGRSRGRGRGRVAPTVKEIPIDNVSVNENLPEYNEGIEEAVEIEDVVEVEQEEGVHRSSVSSTYKVILERVVWSGIHPLNLLQTLR